MALVPVHSKVTIAKGAEGQVSGAGARVGITLNPKPVAALGHIIWTFDGTAPSETNGIETTGDDAGGHIAPIVPTGGNSNDFFEGAVRAKYLGDVKPGGDDSVTINVVNWLSVP